MKIYLLYLVLFIQFSMVSQNLKGIITYEKNLNYDNLISKLENDSIQSSKAVSLLKQLKSTSENNLYELHFNSNESNYFYIKELSNDSEKGALSNLNIVKFKGNLYFNSEEKLMIHNYRFLGELFRVKDTSIGKLTLTKETKKIDDYLCYKAILNKNHKNLNGEDIKKKIVCWYTLDIPVRFGPEKYNSLPGLILEVITDKERIVVSKVLLGEKTGNNISVEKPTKGKEVYHEDLENIARAELKKRMDAMRN